MLLVANGGAVQRDHHRHHDAGVTDQGGEPGAVRRDRHRGHLAGVSGEPGGSSSRQLTHTASYTRLIVYFRAVLSKADVGVPARHRGGLGDGHEQGFPASDWGKLGFDAQLLPGFAAHGRGRTLT
jgi:hypothetical protein